MLPNKLVILGGGATVREGIEKGLFSILPHIFTAGLNFSYRYVNTTVNLGVDEAFANNNITDISNLPMYIGKDHVDLKARPYNCHWFVPCKDYYRDLLPGVYSSTLVGLFSLSLFINLLPKGSEIFLLGYDYGTIKDAEGKNILDSKGRNLTHFYQGEIEHRGIGKINWYSATIMDRVTSKKISQAEKEFRNYVNEKDIKIVIVGKSNIPFFEHITYDEFFQRIGKETYNQDEIRQELKPLLINLRRAQEMFKRNPVSYEINSHLKKG